MKRCVFGTSSPNQVISVQTDPLSIYTHQSAKESLINKYLVKDLKPESATSLKIDLPITFCTYLSVYLSFVFIFQ